MYKHHWISLNLIPNEYLAFDSGTYKTIEPCNNQIVGLPKRGKHYTVLGQAPTRQEAEVIAQILRVMMPS